MIPDWLIQFSVISAIGAIGFFLKARDDAQAKQITALWELVNKHTDTFTELRERLARLEGNNK